MQNASSQGVQAILCTPDHPNMCLDLICTIPWCVGVPSGLLFDWALPLLGQAPGQTRTTYGDIGSQFWALVALRECLAACDDVTLARYGHAVLQACLGLLEAEDTSMHLMGPLLALLIQARHHGHSNLGIKGLCMSIEEASRAIDIHPPTSLLGGCQAVLHAIIQIGVTALTVRFRCTEKEPVHAHGEHLCMSCISLNHTCTSCMQRLAFFACNKKAVRQPLLRVFAGSAPHAFSQAALP